MTVERMIELLEIEKECVLRNADGECNRYCAECDLLQDDTELHEMYTEAIALLKAQEPHVSHKAAQKYRAETQKATAQNDEVKQMIEEINRRTRIPFHPDI